MKNRNKLSFFAVISFFLSMPASYLAEAASGGAASVCAVAAILLGAMFVFSIGETVSFVKKGVEENEHRDR